MKMAVEVQQILGIGSGRHVSCLVATQGGSDEPYADVAGDLRAHIFSSYF